MCKANYQNQLVFSITIIPLNKLFYDDVSMILFYIIINSLIMINTDKDVKNRMWNDIL